MNDALSEALLILAVGMITVFAILGLVVLSGQVLIRITNRFIPDVQVVKPARSIYRSPIARKSTAIEKKKLAAIVAAVEVVTGGRGHIEHVEKI